MAEAYKVAASYRDSILAHQRILCGDDVGEGKAWQEQAMRLSHELERYASFLRDVVGGGYPGTIVFPSWDTRDEWDGHEMVCRVIRKADLVEHLEQSRSLLDDAIFDGRRGLNASMDAMKAKSLVADSTTFLQALGAAAESA